MEITLKVNQAYPSDSGRGIARLDPDAMLKLQISPGDVIEIEGKRKTVAKVWRAPKRDWGKEIIRIDRFIRENAGVGVGDVVIPNILVVSAQVFSNSVKIAMFKLPAITTLLGGLIGLITLLIVAERSKRPHAGLPFLNTGAIIGYIVGCYIL